MIGSDRFIHLYLGGEAGESLGRFAGVRVIAAFLVRLHHIIDIFAGGQDHSRINLEFYRAGIADDQYHADGLGAARTFRQLGLVGVRAVGNGDQGAGVIEQAYLADPPSANRLGDDLLGHQLRWVERVLKQGIKGRAALLPHQCGLCRVGGDWLAVAIPHRHMGDFKRDAQCEGIGDFGLSRMGGDGEIDGAQLAPPVCCG